LTEAALRLFRNSEVTENFTKLRALKQPNLIHKLSNAPRHIIQQRVRAYHTTANETKSETEKEKVRDLLIPYLRCNYACDLLDIRVPQPDDDDTGLLIEYLTFREVRIEQMRRRVRRAAAAEATRLAGIILGENAGRTENSDQYTEPAEVRSLINSVRAAIADMNKGEWKILETALNKLDNLVFVDRAKYEAPKEKRKPGRPTKAKEDTKRKVRNLHDYFERENG
jgi:hypothetical protein